jgi:hypothetical protein
MNHVHAPRPRSRFARRDFLRAAGISLALPILDSVGRSADTGPPIRRIVCCCTTLGIHAENLFPQETGRDYSLTPYLEPLRELRGRIPTSMEGTPAKPAFSRPPHIQEPAAFAIPSRSTNLHWRSFRPPRATEVWY